MTEHKSLEKILPKADNESSVFKLTLSRRIHTIDIATEQEHYLNRRHHAKPAPIRAVVEAPEVSAYAPEALQGQAGLAGTVDVDHTVMYASERDSRLAHAQMQVREAYEVAS